MKLILVLLTLPLLVSAAASLAAWIDIDGEGYPDSGGVKIHYVTRGEGPLLVLLHGFPDFWYSWRRQIPELSKHFKVVALDLRGYNMSDKPAGVESYAMDKLTGDVAAVIEHLTMTLQAGAPSRTLRPTTGCGAS